MLDELQLLPYHVPPSAHSHWSVAGDEKQKGLDTLHTWNLCRSLLIHWAERRRQADCEIPLFLIPTCWFRKEPKVILPAKLTGFLFAYLGSLLAFGLYQNSSLKTGPTQIVTCIWTLLSKNLLCTPLFLKGLYHSLDHFLPFSIVGLGFSMWMESHRHSRIKLVYTICVGS